MNVLLQEKIPAGFTEVFVEKEKGVHLRERGERRELVIGGIDPETMTLRKLRVLVRKIVRTAATLHVEKLALSLSVLRFKHVPLSDGKRIELIATEAVMAAYEPTRYKTEKSPHLPRTLLVHAHADKTAKAALARGVLIGEAVNECRELSNIPGGDMTPTLLAASARKAAKGLPIKVTVLGEQQMRKLGMGAILGVSKGSGEEATFTIMDYKGSSTKPIVLIGKGITFDSGGLNLKSESSIYEMHMDMSGAAAVLSAVTLAAHLKVKRRVIGIFPGVENMPGHTAFRPGDVLHSLAGKTIEVLNTDAEGRLILADAITYAKRFKPSVVLDVATLTGASIVALGQYANGVMTRDNRLAERICDIGEESGDYMWRLPLWDEYEEAIKGSFADIANVPGNGASSRYGGATNGAMFLWQFAKELPCPWAHLDIAPRMTSVPSDELAKGAAGSPVRFFLSFIEQWTP